MVTRLKKFSRNWCCKFAAYILILAFVAAFVVSFLAIETKASDASAFESKTYADSNVCYDELERVIRNMFVMQYDYVSEENVRSGNAIDEYSIYMGLYDSYAYQGYRDRIDNADNSLTGGVAPSVTKIPVQADANVTAAVAQHPDWDIFQDGVFISYLHEHPNEIANSKQEMIEEQLRNFHRVRTFLDSVQGKFFFISYREETKTALKNTSVQELKQSPLYANYDLLEDSLLIYQNGQTKQRMEQHIGYEEISTGTIHPEDKFMVGINPEYLAVREQQWAQDHILVTRGIWIMVLSVALGLILFLYLSLVTGRVPDEDTVQLYWIDHMYSEFHVAIALGLLSLLNFVSDATMQVPDSELTKLLVPTICGIAAVAIPLILSLLRSIKAHRLIRSFAIGRLCIRFFHWSVRSTRAAWESGTLMTRSLLVAALVPLLCGFWVTIPFVMAAAVYVTFHTIKKLQRIQEGVQKVRAGNLDYTIDVQGGALGALAEDINMLSEGLDSAISSEVRAERLKTELISNVSHDIKTPITSIVTYVDLLQNELAKENPDREKSQEYIDIIDQKTQRLRMLTNDLFEAAKATSGSVAVELEQVDASALVRQGLGEFDDKLQEAALDVRVCMPERAAYVYADGRLVWRIFENMLSNVVKYALHGSRVYIDVTRGHGMVTLVIKNISAYELNVPAEELMERFKRGDESRSSEGSGLGLSIATSLAQLQHGTFRIEVDGDLFKATLSLPEYIPQLRQK